LFAVLTYLATSLYAIALGNVGLLGKLGSVVFVVLGVGGFVVYNCILR